MRTKDKILRAVSPITEKAMENFWASVAEQIPEADTGTGDIDPSWSVAFTAQCSDAIKHWIDNNVSNQSRNYNLNRPLDGDTLIFEMKLTKLIESFGAEMQTETFDANGKELG